MSINIQGRRELHCTADNGCLLEDDNNSVNSEDDFDMTPHCNALKGHTGVVPELLQHHSILVNSEDDNNTTAPRCAPKKGCFDVMRELLAHCKSCIWQNSTSYCS